MIKNSAPKLDFMALEPYQKRSFLPDTVNLSDIDVVKVYCQKLIEEEILSAAQLEQWVLNRSELEAAIDQRGSELYIQMTCQTDNEDYAKAYQFFIEKAVPIVKPLEDQLNNKFLKLLESIDLDKSRYEVYVRGIKTDVALFVEENIELEKKVELLSQSYQAICGKQTVEFDGKERTMPQMGKYLLEPDRKLREHAWKKMCERRLSDKNELDNLFDQMFALRVDIAKNAGFESYTEYKFQSLHRFDYTAADCKKYHESVKKIVTPVWIKILEKRKKEMGLEKLRPWDTSVDPKGRQPLKPFDEVDDLIAGCEKIFSQVDPRLGQQFVQMRMDGLLDLESRKGKAPGGYQSTLNEVRKPFIFMNAVGIDQDIRTLLHEGGHAFHAIACCQDPLLSYRHGPMEFCEVASMSMELLGGESLSVFYDDEDKKRSVTEHLEDIVYVLVWVATVDAFQHWLYENPNHTHQERNNMWLTLNHQFLGQSIDWSGFEVENSYLWHRQLHIFQVPFYYIEYAIAQLGALQVWIRSKNNIKEALDAYLKALSLGGSRPLPELFKTAGLEFDFSEKIIAPLIEGIEKELNL